MTAKFSSRLIERIYQHGIECGWLHEGSRVIDPFGGVGLGAWPALRFGMDWSGVELEPRFVILAQANIDAWNARYSGRLARWGTARIIQGDSRHLAQVIGAAEACISSPPYTDTRINTATNGEKSQGETRGEGNLARGYSTSPLNLGNLPPGNVEACISSPPYADGAQHTGGADTSPEYIQGGDLRYVDYGTTPGQLASLPPGAPPFEGCVSSPPYEGTASTSAGGLMRWSSGPMGGDPINWTINRSKDKLTADKERATYGETSGNIGNDSGETFWSAAREIVAQVYQVLAPGTHAIWVTKRYIKDKKIVEFTEQWIALCESIGFKTLHIHRAMLVKHNGTFLTLEGEKIEHKTEYVSFFRRLAQKNGSPRIDWEDVTCMQK